MSREKPRASNSKTPADDYEATVLDFLDEEILASSEPVREGNTQRDEVEEMVSDLIKQTIAASDERDQLQESNPVDLDSLFSDILKTRIEASQAKSRAASPEVDQKPGEPLAGASPSQETSKSHFPEDKPELEAADLPGGGIPPAASEASAVSGALPIPTDSIGQAHPTQSGSASEVPPLADRAAVLGLVSSGPGRSRRVFVIVASLLCLFMAIGICIRNFSGRTAATSSKVVKPAAPTQMLPSPAEDATTPATKSKDLGTGKMQSVIGPSGLAQSTHAAQEVPEGPDEPALTPGTVAAKRREASSKSAPAPDTAAPTASAGRPVAVPAIVGNAGANPKPQIPEIGEPPATIIAPQTSAPLIPGPAAATASSLGAITPEYMSPVRPSTSSKISPAVPISQNRPRYPEAARRMHITGTVVLDVEIDEQGRVVKATPVNGPPLLRPAAVDAVLGWRYKPASVGGATIKSQGQISIVFNNP